MLIEKFLNINNTNDKHQFVDQVWELLQSSYKPIGGLKGNGFESKENMIRVLPFWKLYFSKGELQIVTIYKDKGGRKLVAVGVDNSAGSKSQLKKILAQEFTRSWMEISDPLLKFIVKTFGQDFVKSYAIPKEPKYDDPDPQYCKDYPKLCEYFYSRSIGGKSITKIMVGTKGKIIKFFEWCSTDVR